MTQQADLSGAPSAETIDAVTLASMLSSRICHDLVGPIGALGNGVEFLAGKIDDAARESAFQLIADSARMASAKLQYYRAAFGVGGSISERMRLAELRDMTAALIEGGRVQLDWEPGDEEIDRVAMRILMNLILIGAETLPRGGVLRAGLVTPETGGPGGERMLLVVAESEMRRLSPRIESLLLRGALPEDADHPMEPKESPALLTHRLAAAAGARLSAMVEPDHVILAAAI